MNKEIEICFKELERGISQMEYETNSIKIPDAKSKLLTSLDSSKERYENLKKEINIEKTNDIVIPSLEVNQTKKKNETIAIEVNVKKDTDENIEDKYTITKVGIFTSMLNKLLYKINDMKKVYNIKQIMVPFVIILLFMFLFIFFNYPKTNKKKENLQ